MDYFKAIFIQRLAGKCLTENKEFEYQGYVK